MAIAIEDDNSASAAGANQITFAIVPAGTNRLLVVSGGNSAGENRATLSAITLGVVSVGDSRWDVTNSTFYRAWCNSLTQPATGSATVTIDLSDSDDELGGGAVAFSGVDQTTPIDGVNTATGSSDTISETVTSAVNDLVYDTPYAVYQGNLNETGGGDLRWNELNIGTYIDTAGYTEAGATTVTRSYDKTGGDYNDWIWGGLNINVSAAAAPVEVVVPRRILQRPIFRR